MNLLFGGGSLKLKTDEFVNGEPTGLRVVDFFGFTVTNPLPEPEIINNVSGLIFLKTPYYFQLTFKTSRIRVWNGSEWKIAEENVWNGSAWI